MKKKVLSLLLVLAMALSMIPMASAAAPSTADYTWYGDGSATTFTISDAEDFLGFLNIVSGSDGQTANNFEGKTVALAADIDMGGYAYTSGNGVFYGSLVGATSDNSKPTISHLVVTGWFLKGRNDNSSQIENIGFSSLEAVLGNYDTLITFGSVRNCSFTDISVSKASGSNRNAELVGATSLTDC